MEDGGSAHGVFLLNSNAMGESRGGAGCGLGPRPHPQLVPPVLVPPQMCSCSPARPSPGARRVGSWTSTSSWAPTPRAWCGSTWMSSVGPSHRRSWGGFAGLLWVARCGRCGGVGTMGNGDAGPLLPLPGQHPPPASRFSLHAPILGLGLPPLPLGLLLHRHHPAGRGQHDGSPLPPGGSRLLPGASARKRPWGG